MTPGSYVFPLEWFPKWPLSPCQPCRNFQTAALFAFYFSCVLLNGSWIPSFSSDSHCQAPPSDSPAYVMQ